MAQYIDKAALVAEIDRRLDELYELLPNASKVERGTISISEACNTGKYTALESFKDYLDTLEVREVDLDGISRHYALNDSPWDDCRDEIQDAYKAGFELGMQVSNKAQKGE